MAKQPFRFTFFLLICFSLPLTATAQDGIIDPAELDIALMDEADEPINIPDPNLRAAIEAELGKAAGDAITAADMANLTELTARNANISNLTGLERAINLRHLNLSRELVAGNWINSNSVSDLSPLAGLTNLTGLFVAHNNITDISPLAGLTSLTGLWLERNAITDISPVAGLTNLKQLNLGGNNLSNISPLAGLTNLRQLWLWDNAITDISPVAGLTNLTELILQSNTITDISPVARLTNLTGLWLAYNTISDISPLVANIGLGSGDRVFVNDNPLNRASIETHIPALQDRDVTVEFDNVITELVNIPDENLRAVIEAELGKASGDTITTADMANLTELTARNKDISNLTGLEAAINLTQLDLGSEYVEAEERFINSNSVSDLSPLAGLTNLTRLRLRNNSISNILPLAGLTNLTYLNLGGNLMISDLSPLARLTNLETLWLYANSISDISALAGLTNLTSLYLWFNSISDLSPLAGLTSLTRLGLYNNLISNLSPLAGLTNLGYLALSNYSIVIPATGLTHLSLNNNSISDLSPLVENTGLKAGDTVEVWGNPLSEASIHTHIPALQNRGVTVDVGTPTLLLKISGTVTDSDNLLIVEVQNSRRRLLEGVPVTFTVISGGGTLSVTNTTTDANGRAESRLTLGPDTGTNTVRASVEGISQTVTFSDVPEPPVDIPDSNLRAAIERTLGKASGDTITASDMARLTEIFAPNANISDLTGLEAAINLTFLAPDNNNITNISPLSGLTNLTILTLGNNSISDISPLSGLTNLTFLVLSGNNISDISPLTGLTNLTRMVLGNNSISDISPLAGLTNIELLFLNDNTISDISPLVANTGLGSGDTVNVRGNPLSSLSLYTHIPALQNRGVAVEFDLPVETLSGHTDGVVSVAFSPDGSILASGSADNTVQLWDTVTELPIDTLIGHTAMARSVAFSPDGSILASGGHDGTVRLWDVATRTPTDILLGHTAGVESVAFNREGSILASGSHDGTVRLWDALTGDPIDTLTEHIDSGWSVAFSPDGTLAIGNNNGTILLWDVAAGQLKDTLIGHTGHVESVAFNRAGTMLASGSGDSTVRLWDALTGDPIDTLTGHTRGINSVAFSPDGTILASGSDDSTVRLWDAVTGDPIDTLRGHASWVRSVAFNRDGSVLASGSGDSTIRLWELTPPTIMEYTLSIPAGLNLIHVPLKVTTVHGMEQTIESVGDLYDALGGAGTVNFLITYDSQAQEWRSFFVSADKGTSADAVLNDDTGIIASMKVLVSIRLSGNPLGTNGSSTVTLNQGLNLVGLPLNDSRINRVSDLHALEGIEGNISVIIFTDGGEFKVVGRPGDPSDIEITGGQGFIMTAQRDATVTISGDAWVNDSGAAVAPPVTRKGIEVRDTTPVLALRGSIADEGTGLKVPNFRVTVKNLSTLIRDQESTSHRVVTAATGDEGIGYQAAIVDVETGRAAQIGDIFKISAQSPNPFIGVHPLRYTVTAEDVKQGWIQLPALVAYEIPAETELLPNYPNPFNPETWIPYRLAEDAFVTLTIYDGTGQVVRTLDVGHQTAAVYESRSKAIYWDGRNGLGEQVASGVYFYHLSAGDYSATRKMLILK